jgi:predicted 3-demethylubiquinone-9 3-methyltransferase (glyoxalase superfamily)
MQKVTTCLMFVGEQHGKAEEAINLYTSLVKDSKILQITRYGAGEQGVEGTVVQATFTLKGQEFLAMDSHLEHPFTFTPAISLFVQCESEAEIDPLFSQLSSEGAILMPLNNYGFSKKFGWLNDKYGVSWQLNLS